MLNDLFLLGKLTGLGLVILLPLANPLTSMTMLLSLGQHIPYKERAADPPGGVLCGGHHAGDLLRRGLDHEHLRHLDTRLRIAGGLIVMVLGFSMLFPWRSRGRARGRADGRGGQARRRPNIAFVPLAMPGTAGPGTIAMIISAASSMNSDELAHVPAWVLAVVPIVVFALLGLIFWICLTSAGKIVALIGHEGVEAISRVMGFLLVCMGVQFVINGVLEIAHGLP